MVASDVSPDKINSMNWRSVLKRNNSIRCFFFFFFFYKVLLLFLNNSWKAEAESDIDAIRGSLVLEEQIFF